MNTLKEFLLESLQKSFIFEMALSRKELKDKVDALIYQIIENWCLINHCKLFDKHNININHWKKELRGHMINIFNKSLKGGNYQTKFKLIEETIVDKLEITTAEKISRLIKAKFKDENFTVSKDVCNNCIEELYAIMQMMSNADTSQNLDTIIDYIDNL